MTMLFKSAERNNNLDGRLGVDFYHHYKVNCLLTSNLSLFEDKF